MTHTSIIYTRVSTGKQGDSIEMQTSKCASFCELSGYKVIDTIVDEAVSGSVPIFERKGGKRLQKQLKDITHVVVWKMDRMFRDTMDCLRTIEELNKLGVSLCIVDMGGQPVDTSSPIGKVFMTMVSAFGEFERNTIKDRITKSMRYRKENRVVYNGTPPFGMKHLDGKIVPGDGYEIAKKIVELKDLGHTYGQIASEVSFSRSKIQRVIKNREFYV